MTEAATNAHAARTPRILFVPVSGKYGMGEYARSLAIARGVSHHWHNAAIHFVLSRQAPYAADPVFATTLLDSSPTFHSAAVIELVEALRPDVVIFDNAGRTAQLRAARRVGARVVYISARARQRRKAFRWRWLNLIDEHWIAYPEFIAGKLGYCERLKLRLLSRPVVRFLDVIFARADPARRGALLSRAGCAAGTYVLVIPGGGTGHPGGGDAVAEFRAAARILAAHGVPTVFVGPDSADAEAGDDACGAQWHPVGALPQADLVELMRCAKLTIANGGSTLLQAIACGNACIAVPIAHDQVERIRRCVAAGVAVQADCDAPGMVKIAEYLLNHEPERMSLSRRAADLKLADGVDVAIRALKGLIEAAPRSVPA